MKDRKHYISLKFKGENRYHGKGKRLRLTDSIINIGETSDCDVRFEHTECQPIYYASIVRNEDGQSWRIVKRSQFVDVEIDGRGSIGYACQLKDGDVIRIEGQPLALCFHTHFDDDYDEDGKDDNIWQWALVGVLGLVTIVALALNLNQKDSITPADVEPLEESVFLVKVDSVRKILAMDGKEQYLADTKALSSDAPTGTAFLTNDGIMVTARHCIEYWIGCDLKLTTRLEDLAEEDIRRWAIEVETFNQMHSKDTMMLLKVYFSLYDFMGEKRYAFCSTDSQVHINRERDGVFLLADFSQDYYWRTIRPYFKDRKMELGDILWIDGMAEKGKIQMATHKNLADVKSGTPLMICGYPMTGIGDKRTTFTEGIIRRRADVESENLFFESNINHGFSGGPLLMKSGNDIVAIGVVSRVDSVSSGLYKWAVPVTEIKGEK